MDKKKLYQNRKKELKKLELKNIIFLGATIKTALQRKKIKELDLFLCRVGIKGVILNESTRIFERKNGRLIATLKREHHLYISINNKENSLLFWKNTSLVSMVFSYYYGQQIYRTLTKVQQLEIDLYISRKNNNFQRNKYKILEQHILKLFSKELKGVQATTKLSNFLKLKTSKTLKK